MKNILTLTLIAMTSLSAACTGAKTPATPPANTLTPDEIAAGRFTPEVMWKMGRIGSFALSPDGTTVVYERTDYDVASNGGTTTLWLQPTGGGPATRLATPDGSATAPAWSPDGAYIYYLADDDGHTALWRTAPNGTSTPHRVSDRTLDITHFGIAPSADRIFYVRRVKVDPKASSEIYDDLPKSAALIYDELMVRHWNRWRDGSHLHIFVADLGADGTLSAGKDIMEGEPYDAPMEPYFDGAEIAWNNAGTAIAYTCKKMGDTEYASSTDSDIYIYDLARGTTTNICKSLGANAMPGYDKYPVWSPDDSRIAIRSMRRPGHEADKERLLVWEAATGKFTDLTAAFDHSAGNVSWDGPDALRFITPWFGTHQICRVDMTGNVEILTRGDHDIDGMAFADGKAIVSLTKLDSGTELYTLKEGELSPLTDVNGNISNNIDMGRIEKRTIPTTDGQQMLTWIVYPPDFDPTKQYPALLYCQGGPQSTLGWSYRWNFQLMAAEGYVVVAPCRRGVPGFGQQWTDQISGDYSGQNIRDLLTAIDEVAREPWIDSSRLGCVGASYGGYSSFYLAGVHQGRFKAFVAHCGIFNFESMYGTTEELFFPDHDYGGTYWSNAPVARRSYAASPHKLVEKWDTPMLIITGLNDFRVPYSQSLEAHTAARLVGVPSRLVAFENEAHQVFKPQNNLVWNREFFGWLDKYVKGAK